MGQYKAKYEAKYGKIKKLGPLIIDIKKRIDKILNTFKNRVTYKKRQIKSIYTKQINSTNNFNELLDLVKLANKDIVDKFLTNMTKKSDITIALKEAEQGFEKMSMMSIADKISRFFEKIFHKDVKDIEFELNQGYFTELYNEYNQIKNPNQNDIDSLKNNFISKLNEVCNDIEKFLHKKIEDVRAKLTEEKLEKYFNKL